MNSSFILRSIVIGSLGLLLVSCGGKKTYTTEEGSVEVDQESGKVTFKGSDGKGGNLTISGGAGAKVPESFPSDVAIYRPAKVNAGMSMAGTETVMLETLDSADSVLDFYAKSLADAGWVQVSEMNAGPMNARSFEKDDRRVSLNVVTDAQNQKTTVSVAVTKKRN